MSESENNVRIKALLFGFACHGAFLWAVWSMFWGIRGGFSDSAAGYSPLRTIVTDATLLLQFPVLHSLLLSDRGRKFLETLSFDRRLATTLFSLISSLQLVLVFNCWASSGIVLYTLPNYLNLIFNCFYVASWLFLARTMFDAGLAYQTGAIGWWAVYRREKPKFPGMPTGGTFKLVRQPIYLAFFLILWTSPSGSLDRILLAVTWGLYLVFAPRLKEQRFERFFGDKFRAYRATVPYFIPRFFAGKNSTEHGNAPSTLRV